MFQFLFLRKTTHHLLKHFKIKLLTFILKLFLRFFLNRIFSFSINYTNSSILKVGFQLFYHKFITTVIKPLNLIEMKNNFSIIKLFFALVSPLLLFQNCSDDNIEDVEITQLKESIYPIPEQAYPNLCWRNNNH